MLDLLKYIRLPFIHTLGLCCEVWNGNIFKHRYMHSLEHILSSHCVWEDQSLLLSSRIGFPNISQVVMLDTYYSDLHLPLFASHYYLLLVDELLLVWSAWHLQILEKEKL